MTIDQAKPPAKRLIASLDQLWYATDFAEAGDPRNYSLEERMKFLGEWIHGRKACNRLFDAIRLAHPELPGWDPIGKSIAVEERLRNVE